MLGEKQSVKFKMISLSNDTIRSRIQDMSHDVLEQIVSSVKDSPIFSLQLDESTDVASCAQLIVFVRYISGTDLKEEHLFSEPLTTTTRGEEVFKVLAAFITKH